MVSRLNVWLAVAVLTCGVAACSSAATITDESVVGDFSNSGAANTITKVNFTAGSNQILGATGRNSAGAVDRDYLTFTVPTGLGLTAITPLPGTQSAGPLGLSFIGLEAGNQLTLAPTAATAAGLLGWAHYSTSDIGVNILNTMATPNTGSSGFSVPLGPGDYAVWIQELSSGSLHYGFDFALGQVPEPGTWLLLVSGITLFGAALRSRRRIS